MQYAILTTKHHDGFALWPTKQTDFSIAQTPYDGDLVGEYVDAARAAGLRVGFYYSLSDWHHPDYPAFREEDKPYLKFLGRRSDTWDAYLDVHVRTGPRAAHELRRDLAALVRRTVGTHGRRVAGRRAASR